MTCLTVISSKIITNIELWSRSRHILPLFKTIAMYIRTFICFLIFFVFESNAQTSLKPISVAGSTLKDKDVIIIAETHSITEKSDFYNAFLYSLATEQNISNVVIESSHSEAFLFNRYLQYGDTTLLMYFQDSGSHRRIVAMKNMYDLLPVDKKIKIFGIDFERMEFVVASRIILALNHVEGTALNHFLNNFPDSLLFKIHMSPTESKLRIAIYDSARRIFEKEQAQLKAKISTDYDVLEHIFMNPTQEAKFARRDLGMFQNMDAQLKGKPFVAIVGLYHATYTRHQVFPSLIKLLLKNGLCTEEKLTIINEISNKKYLVNRLWDKEGTPPQYTDGVAGPEYFTDVDSAMYRGYHNYFSGDTYVLAHKSLFNDIVFKGNHGLDEYFVFFGNRPLN